MATNYSKYINSTATHYISNSGSDEHKEYHGGKAGDQTGHEWELKAWYPRPWTCVLRHPDSTVRQMIAEYAIDAALNSLIGYDQYQRYSYWTQLQNYNYKPSQIKTACEADCTAGVTANVKAIGHVLGVPKLENIEKDTTSRNMRSRFEAADFTVLTEPKYLNGYNYLLPGDILLYDNHHAATNITKGKYASSGNTSTKTTISTGDVILKNGMSGSAVKEMQSMLIKLGYNLGRWGADGEFGDMTQMAVEEFQSDNDLPETGKYDSATKTILEKKYEASKVIKSDAKEVLFVGNCYIRKEANRNSKDIGVARQGTKLPYKGKTASNGWLSVEYKNELAWVSGVYGKLV